MTPSDTGQPFQLTSLARLYLKLVLYPIPSDCNKLHAISAIVPGEIAMVKRLLGALRTRPSQAGLAQARRSRTVVQTYLARPDPMRHDATRS